MSELNREKLIVFVKAPRPGGVKTRLAEAIGPQAACAAYRRLVEMLLANLASLQELELRFSPDDAAAELRSWLLRPRWRLRPQGDGDLGRRLQRAFADAFADGPARVLIIGSDCPRVTAEDIRAGWRALESHDAVIGPASDGGYWLIGLRTPRQNLFDDIDWSTDEVLEQTLDRATSAGLRIALLRELSDVDTDADWKRFLADQGGARPVTAWAGKGVEGSRLPEGSDPKQK